MNRRKLLKGAIGFLQVVVMLGIAGMSGYFLMRYCAYGERAVSGKVQKPEADKIEKSSSRAIRVRIMDDDFAEDIHQELILDASEGMTVIRQKREGYDLVGDEADAGVRIPEGASELVKSALRQSAAWNQNKKFNLQVTPDDLEESEVLILEPVGGGAISVSSLKRACGTPQYYGCLYVWKESGGIALLNVLPLEQYLYSVVSSEMPSSYPLEAQKAQAVCARTYAVNCMDRGEEGELAADVSDSVNFQVYNNYGMTDSSKQAVDETTGEILPLQDIQYYSTSCLSEHRTDLDSDEAFAAFLEEEPAQGAEYGSRWLRWRLDVSKEELLERIEEEYPYQTTEGETAVEGKQAPEGEQTAEVRQEPMENDDVPLRIVVTKRRGDGQAQELRISCGDAEFTVEGEYDIRKILGIPQEQITLMDGSQAQGMRLLPSAFFCIAQEEQDGEVKFAIWGGGYGHGNGMSQCGAAAMAEKGMDYKTIIGYYYSVDDR